YVRSATGGDAAGGKRRLREPGICLRSAAGGGAIPHRGNGGHSRKAGQGGCERSYAGPVRAIRGAIVAICASSPAHAQGDVAPAGGAGGNGEVTGYFSRPHKAQRRMAEAVPSSVGSLVTKSPASS